MWEHALAFLFLYQRTLCCPAIRLCAVLTAKQGSPGMKSLRISMIAPFGMRPKGTLQARMLPLAQALARRGHTLQIVAPPTLNPEDAGQCVELDGVQVLHTRLPRLGGPVGVLEQAALLRHAALAPQPDMVHLFKPKGFGGLAVLAMPQAIPFVLDSDDWEGWGGWNDLLPYPWPARMLFAWQERTLPTRARAVTVASRTLERQVRGFGVAPQRVFYLPNGTEARRVAVLGKNEQGDARPPTLLVYTRFWEFEIAGLVAALVGIASRYPHVRVLVVGRGERGEERELARLMQHAGIGELLDYRGWVEPQHLPQLLASADIALAPMDNTLINRARGLAKLLELMELGLPIVASRVGQAAEYLEHGQSGWLVESGNAGAFAAGVLAVLADTSLRERLAAGARRRAQGFAWDALAGVAEQAYRASFEF
jgi:glycosyltransferase involved in cell wall biosynthesis